MELIRSINNEKIFRIWLMKDLQNRRFCHGTDFQDLIRNIISQFSLPEATYELRNGLDGTIIDNNFAFSWQKCNSILVLLNKKNGEEWEDSIVSKIKEFSPGNEILEQQKQIIMCINDSECVQIGNENIIAKSITSPARIRKLKKCTIVKSAKNFIMSKFK